MLNLVLLSAALFTQFSFHQFTVFGEILRKVEYIENKHR